MTPENDALLSSSTSVETYRKLEAGQDQDAIASFIYERFSERYVEPFKQNKAKNGFIMMASACLMIEALESFWQGWKKSPNSRLAFCQYFDRNEQLLPFRGYGSAFYTHVRCGIMHQGETTGGWRIRRDLPRVFDSDNLTIDATRFVALLDACLRNYQQILRESDWDSNVWRNLRKKMKSLCANTSRGA